VLHNGNQNIICDTDRLRYKLASGDVIHDLSSTNYELRTNCTRKTDVTQVVTV